jgi:aminomethyltransferase
MTSTSALRRTPLYDCHLEAGAKIVDFAGWEMPVQYTGVIEEHRAVRTAAGLFDVSHMGEVRVRGARAEAFLDAITPNALTKLQAGRAHYSGLLTVDGTYLDDLLIYRVAGDNFLVVVNASNADADFAEIARRAVGWDDVTVTNESDDWALLALQGPRATAILQRLTTTNLAAIKYYGFATGSVDGVEMILSRTGYTGEDGFELYLPPAAAPQIWRLLLREGAGDGLIPAGLGARDTLRLEAGMALYGHEIDAATTPFDAGLDWVVKLDKGDFTGRAALAAQRVPGGEPTRRLVGVEVTGRGIARQGHTIWSGDRQLGAVTSGTWSPTLEKAIAMAYVSVDSAAVGTAVEIDVRGRRLPAVVVPLPFYKRAK